jgi:hypothetical protein
MCVAPFVLLKNCPKQTVIRCAKIRRIWSPWVEDRSVRVAIHFIRPMPISTEFQILKPLKRSPVCTHCCDALMRIVSTYKSEALGKMDII